MQVSWTVTQAEYDAAVRAGTRRTWLATGLPGLVVTVAVAGLLGLARGWFVFLALVAAGLLVAGWSRVAAGRSVRRMFAASYPVGATVQSRASGTALTLDTAAGVVEVPWERLARPRVEPDLVVLKDSVSRHWMLIPRPLFPEAWLERVGSPIEPA